YSSRAAGLSRVLEVSPREAIISPMARPTASTPSTQRLPPGVHLLDDAGDAPDLVAGQTDDEGPSSSPESRLFPPQPFGGHAADAVPVPTHRTPLYRSWRRRDVPGSVDNALNGRLNSEVPVMCRGGIVCATGKGDRWRGSPFRS